MTSPRSHDDLPPELRHVDEPTTAYGRDRAATRFFGSGATHRTVAWVVIAAMVLVPLGVSVLSMLTR